jgi:molybdopterin-guanine dinucleotide biosynthesis protein A
LETSAIILAGGSSKRLGQDKGLTKLGGEPLIKHVLKAASNVVDNTVVVVSSREQKEKYAKSLGSSARVTVDSRNLRGPVIGSLTGLECSGGTYALILACDMPFVSQDVLSLLLDLCVNKSAAIPRWPNCYIEPLQACYCVKLATDAAKCALGEGETKIQALVDRLRGVRYISTLVLQQLDPELRTFFNVNTPLDLKKAEKMLQSQC